MKSEGLITKQECFFGEEEGSGNGSGISFVPMTWHNVQKTSAFNHFFFRSLYILSFPFHPSTSSGKTKSEQIFRDLFVNMIFWGFPTQQLHFPILPPPKWPRQTLLSIVLGTPRFGCEWRSQAMFPPEWTHSISAISLFGFNATKVCSFFTQKFSNRAKTETLLRCKPLYLTANSNRTRFPDSNSLLELWNKIQRSDSS